MSNSRRFKQRARKIAKDWGVSYTQATHILREQTKLVPSYACVGEISVIEYLRRIVRNESLLNVVVSKGMYDNESLYTRLVETGAEVTKSPQYALSEINRRFREMSASGVEVADEEVTPIITIASNSSSFDDLKSCVDIVREGRAAKVSLMMIAKPWENPSQSIIPLAVVQGSFYLLAE